MYVCKFKVRKLVRKKKLRQLLRKGARFDFTDFHIWCEGHCAGDS